MKVYSFEKPIVWQDSKKLVTDIYKRVSFRKKNNLISLLKRSSVSIPSNLIEWTSRKTNKNKAHFTTISFNSTIEVLNQIIISKELNFIPEKDYIFVREKLEKITNMLNALQNAQLKINV